MKAKLLCDLGKNETIFVDEVDLLIWGYHCENDDENKIDTFKLLEKIYKKRTSQEDEPTIVIIINGRILHKIWTEKGRVSRQNGKPADIMYDENGIIDSNWYLSGKCINDYISFVCLKKKKEKIEIDNNDIAFIKDYFAIK